MRKYVLWTAILIGVYVAVSHARGFAAVENATAQGGANFVKSLQGR